MSKQYRIAPKAYTSAAGPISSIFDYATFAVLLWVMKASEQTFQTGWFIESILSAGVVVFAVRTRLPFTRSRPSRAMLAVTGVVMLVTLGLPYSPLAGSLGFVPLPTKWYIDIGEPISMEQYPEKSEQNLMLVSQLTDQVRNIVQKMIFQRLAQRRSIFFG